MDLAVAVEVAVRAGGGARRSSGPRPPGWNFEAVFRACSASISAWTISELVSVKTSRESSRHGVG